MQVNSSDLATLSSEFCLPVGGATLGPGGCCSGTSNQNVSCSVQRKKEKKKKKRTGSLVQSVPVHVSFVQFAGWLTGHYFGGTMVNNSWRHVGKSLEHEQKLCT